MMLFERITFLMVTGTLILFFLAFLFGVWGAVLTLYPNLAKSVVKSVSVSAVRARTLLEQGREYALRTYRAYESSFRGRLQARS